MTYFFVNSPLWDWFTINYLSPSFTGKKKGDMQGTFLWEPGTWAVSVISINLILKKIIQNGAFAMSNLIIIIFLQL